MIKLFIFLPYIFIQLGLSLGSLNSTITTKYVNSSLVRPGDDFASIMCDLIEISEDTKGYCTVENPIFPVNNIKLCKTPINYNVGYKFEFVFYESKPAYYEFEIGVDFGKGVAAFVDGVLFY